MLFSVCLHSTFSSHSGENWRFASLICALKEFIFCTRPTDGCVILAGSWLELFMVENFSAAVLRGEARIFVARLEHRGSIHRSMAPPPPAWWFLLKLSSGGISLLAMLWGNLAWAALQQRQGPAQACQACRPQGAQPSTAGPALTCSETRRVRQCPEVCSF